VTSTPTIFWFRRDLRLSDNPALVEAARRGDGEVAAVFVVDASFARPAGSTRVAFLRACLESLDASLDGRLAVRVGDPAAQLEALAREVGAREVVATGDYGPRGATRDVQVREVLGARGIDVHFVDSPYVVAPGTVLTKAGTPCRAFGAYRRGWEVLPQTGAVPAPTGVRWREVPSTSLDELTKLAATTRPEYFGDLPDAPPAALLSAGEDAAHGLLERFMTRVDSYDQARDVPGVNGTSRLSAHLRFGSLHPRQVLAALDGHSSGWAVYRSQLCWRDFYADVMFHNPASVRRVLQPSLEHLRVDTDARAVARFHAWARGETGYPLVDAGMRQLLHEGWMHNRVRMVAASFLVKHLHLDWRWGARWFMWRLIDGDLASNYHGWQWTAGTGTDAAPFHRVFNPTRQAERFDPEGTYVHRYVTELAAVTAPQCLQPGGGEGLLRPAGYVAPIVDAPTERDDALARYAEARRQARADS
jgi:deoxyribodipyrimidine photo-lyase